MRRFAGLLSFLVLLVGNLQAQQDIVGTTIGGGPNDVPATDSNLSLPSAVALDNAGNYYIAAAGQNRIFKVDPTGTLTVFAGLGVAGYAGDGVTGGAASAFLNHPTSVAVDGNGNVYIADEYNFVIRKVNTANTITTIAGIAGSCTYDGEGTATAHSLCYPQGVAVDGGGNIFIGDASNCRVRKVTGTTISTYAGNGTCGYSGDNGQATSAELNYPTGVATDSTGNLFFADTNNWVIREVAKSTAKITTVAGNHTNGFSGDGFAATSAEISAVYQLAVNGTGTTVTIADQTNMRIRQFTVGGTINTVVGSGTPGFCGDNGPPLSACLYYPTGVAVDTGGNIYIGDLDNERVRKVASGLINTIAGNGSTTEPTLLNAVVPSGVVLNYPFGVYEDSSSNVFVPDTDNFMVRELVKSSGLVDFFAGTGVSGYNGDNQPATKAELSYNYGVAKDSAGNLYIADTYNHIVRKVNTAGTITTIAGIPQRCGYTGDGGSATSAELCYPYSVFVDSANTIWIGDTYNHAIRQVKNGTINTVAGIGIAGYGGDGGPATNAKLYYPEGVAVDKSGNLYIADFGNCRIREVNGFTQIINTVAGNGACGFTGDGPALEVDISGPSSVWLDANDNLFIADTNNQRLRWVDTAGYMTTFAGTGTFGYLGDGGLATSAEFAYPSGIVQDSSGNFTVADQYNFRIRSISAFSALNRSTSSLTFGLQNVNTTSTPQQVILSAVGPLTISSITASGDFSESDDCGVLTNGGTCTMYVFFTPTASGTRTGTITIADNGFFSVQQTITLVGTGAAMSASPSTLAFGNQQVKTTSAAKVITLTNNGSTSITMGAITLTETTDFAISANTCPASGSPLAGHASCTISVTFTPQSTGAKKGAVVINDGDPTSPQIVGLTGTGTSKVTFNPSSVTFATPQAIGVTSAAMTVTLTNSTGASLTLGNPALTTTGDFHITTTGTTCTNGLVIANGNTCVIKVNFKPTAIGTRTGLLSVADSDSSSPQTVTLTGTGTAIKFAPTSLNYGNVTKGSTVGLPVTISNVGTSTVVITSGSLTGTNSADFSAPGGNPPCSGNIVAGGNCTLTIYFTPSIIGAEKATYSIFDNGGGSVQKLALSGTGD
ncbi:MAG TPA: choice-of-anchor D domain-containing protein [Terriglobales bacterium]|nr:choice-of-anchor D domain-containing protein [Terriglobales bacterium]